MRTKRNFLFARKWFKHFNDHMCHWLIVTISTSLQAQTTIVVNSDQIASNRRWNDWSKFISRHL